MIKRRADTVLDVTVVLLEKGYASTAIAPIEVFHSAGALWNWLHGEDLQPRFRVKAASVEGGHLETVCGLSVIPHYSIDEIKRTDIIIVSASGWDMKEKIAANGKLLKWLRKHHSQGAYIAGICSGVLFLAEAGLLDGKQATTHWGVADVLRARYPKVDWRSEQFVTEDGQMFCSGGVYAAIDLSLYLVEKFCGHEIALKTAKSLLVSMPRTRQSGYSVVPLSPPHSDDRIRETEDYLRAHFARDVTIEVLAERAGMSSRNFIRRFKAATGRLPGAYQQSLRIAAAKEMLEQGASSIQTVSSEVGYTDLAFFRRLFKRQTGMTPADYRARFASMNFERSELRRGRDGAAASA